MKIVRFKGKFRDLIPAGWAFQKLFARNYRQYHKTCDGEKYSQGCRIWQHHGGYLEIADLYSDSFAIVEKVIDGTIKEWGSFIHHYRGTPDEKKLVYWLEHDAEKHTFYPYHSPEYKVIKQAEWDLSKMPKCDATDEAYDKHFEKYREFNLRLDTIAMIQEMIDKNWLEIVEVPDEA